MSSFVEEKHYIPFKSIERGIIYSIYTGDIDNDGSDELLLIGERFAYVLKIYDLEKKYVEMRQYIPDPANIPDVYVPKGGFIGDVDGDGKQEIVLAITLGTGQSYRLSFKNFRVEKKVEINFKINGMTSGDIDGDGIPEFIIYGDSEGADKNIMIIKNGEIIGSFLEGLEVFAADIGDIDGDGEKEIVLSLLRSQEGTKQYFLEAYKFVGDSLQLVFKVPTSREVIKISIEDIDRDGIEEIYVMSAVKVSALRFSGSRIDKLWDTPEVLDRTLRDFLSADFDRDNYIETLVVIDNRLTIYEHGIPESSIEESIQHRGFTCADRGKIKGEEYIIAGLDTGLRIGKL